jgi:UMF1 family MFS transporter
LSPGPLGLSRRAWAWALYDWANSAFPVVVTTFVISAWFTAAVAESPVAGQEQWGWMQSAAGLAIALLSPVLGAVADAGARRRLMLVACTLAMAAATALLWFARPDPSWAVWVLVWVGVGTLAFELGTVFYNAMLTDVAPRAALGRVSGIAWGMGYAGGLVCLVVALFVLIKPVVPLGLDAASGEPVRAAALLVAAWTLLFGWPVLVLLPDPPGVRVGWLAAARGGLAEIWGLLRRLPDDRQLARFLAARLFYTDGLNTLFAFGAVYAAGVFGMTLDEVILFGIALNATAGLGAAGFGMVEDRIGSKRTVVIALSALMVLSAGLLVVHGKTGFWVLALMLGVFVGPAQAASRTLMARMAPPEEVGAHFGLFALSGRVTGFLGPMVLAAVTAASGSQRVGMATILVFLGVGLALLLGVREVRK